MAIVQFAIAAQPLLRPWLRKEGIERVPRGSHVRRADVHKNIGGPPFITTTLVLLFSSLIKLLSGRCSDPGCVKRALSGSPEGVRRAERAQKHRWSTAYYHHFTTCYTGYVDLEKAFDSVPRALIYRALEMIGVPKGVSDMVKELYRDQRVMCKAEKALSGQEKATTRGVKQGCPLSPLLFNLCLEFLLKQMDLGKGTTVLGGKKAAEYSIEGTAVAEKERQEYLMREFLFADDIALVAETRKKLEKALQNLTDVFAKYGLTVSISKTKWQALSPLVIKCDEKVKINGKPIERVPEFVYLGSVFNELGTVSSDVQRRIQLANNAMRRVRKIIWHKGTPRGLKRKILMTFIYPTLTYSCETWPLTNSGQEMAALKTWWNRQLRKCCGVTKHDRVRMKLVFQKTGAQPIEDLIRERRLRYLGHVLRYPQKRLTKQIIGAIAKGDRTKRENLGWARVMAKEVAHFGIKITAMNDKDAYRDLVSNIFYKPKGACSKGPGGN